MGFSIDQRMSAWKCHNSQLESHFFSRLPTELRLHVYRHALAPIFTVEPYHTGCPRKPHNFRLRFDHHGDPDDDLHDGSGDVLEAMDVIPALARSIPGCIASSLRPDLNGRPCLSPILFLVCRRMLVEARPVLFECERTYWFATDLRSSLLDMGKPPAWYHAGDQDRDLLGLRLQWEQHFSKLRILTPITAYYSVFSSHRGLLSHVRHLRITIRRADWRLYATRGDATEACFGWGQGPLEINPLGPPGTLGGIAHTAATMAATSDFGRKQCVSEAGDLRPSWMPPGVRFTAGMWAREFINMPCIRSFTMDFDATEERRDELAAIVEWAVRAWRFPLNPAHGGHHYLAADVDSVRPTSWRGTAADWNWLGPCASCNPSAAAFSDAGPDAAVGLGLGLGLAPTCPVPVHARIMARFRRDLGPRIYSWSVTWTPRTYCGPEEYPYVASGCLETLPGDVGMDVLGQARSR